MQAAQHGLKLARVTSVTLDLRVHAKIFDGRRRCIRIGRLIFVQGAKSWFTALRCGSRRRRRRGWMRWRGAWDTRRLPGLWLAPLGRTTEAPARARDMLLVVTPRRAQKALDLAGPGLVLARRTRPTLCRAAEPLETARRTELAHVCIRNHRRLGRKAVAPRGANQAQTGGAATISTKRTQVQRSAAGLIGQWLVFSRRAIGA